MRAMLLMKKIFYDAIRDGTKTTTLRFWQRRMVRPGSEHRIRGLGRVRIDEVRPVELSDLTEADARADGLAGLEALRVALDEMYPPEQRKGRTLYLVGFTFLGQ
jgi:hypothetical protein